MPHFRLLFIIMSSFCLQGCFSLIYMDTLGIPDPVVQKKINKKEYSFKVNDNSDVRKILQKKNILLLKGPYIEWKGKARDNKTGQPLSFVASENNGVINVRYYDFDQRKQIGNFSVKGSGVAKALSTQNFTITTMNVSQKWSGRLENKTSYEPRIYVDVEKKGNILVATHYLEEKNWSNKALAKNIIGFTFIPIPVALDIVFFPFNIYFLIALKNFK